MPGFPDEKNAVTHRGRGRYDQISESQEVKHSRGGGLFDTKKSMSCTWGLISDEQALCTLRSVGVRHII
jgi:hypothetical protein